MAQICVAEIDDTGKPKCLRVDEDVLRARVGVEANRRGFDANQSLARLCCSVLW
jgi:hypothetical protein